MSEELRTRDRRTFADNKAIPTGVYGERWENVLICEKNRATCWEHRPDGIQQLIDICHNWYRRKNVNACVYGVDDGTTIRYAVFLQAGFMREVSEDEDLTPRKRKQRNGRQEKQRLRRQTR